MPVLLAVLPNIRLFLQQNFQFTPETKAVLNLLHYWEIPN